MRAEFSAESCLNHTIFAEMPQITKTKQFPVFFFLNAFFQNGLKWPRIWLSEFDFREI